MNHLTGRDLFSASIYGFGELPAMIIPETSPSSAAAHWSSVCSRDSAGMACQQNENGGGVCTMNEEPLLSARGLTKSYVMVKRTLEVLRGVDLNRRTRRFPRAARRIRRGQKHVAPSYRRTRHAERGRNFSSAARISRNFPRANETAFRRRCVGFIFQAYYLLPELTALENVCLPARVARTSASDAEKRGRDLLARVGLAERMEHKPLELPAANNNASPSPARSSTSRNCYLPTNRRAIWIPTPAVKSLNCSKVCALKNR